MKMNQFTSAAGSAPYGVRYIVEHRVDEPLCARFEQYMIAHLDEVGSTGFFDCASFERIGLGHYRLVWLLPDMQSLDEYQRDHAPALRASFALLFPEGVRTTRTHSAVLATWLGAGASQLA
jgi:hypothetical protein